MILIVLKEIFLSEVLIDYFLRGPPIDIYGLENYHPHNDNDLGVGGEVNLKYLSQVPFLCYI